MHYPACTSILILLMSCMFHFSGFTQILSGSQKNLGPVTIPYSADEIIIDGDLEDWNEYAEFFFRDTNSRLLLPNQYLLSAVYPGFDTSRIRLPLSRNDAKVFLCLNRENLYIAFRVIIEIHGHNNP